MDKPSLPSWEVPISLAPKHIPMLSTTKLGAAPHTSLALRRKTEMKNIAKFFEQLKPWQQKLMASVLIERCDGPALEQLNNILQVLTHRDFQASFNKKYPEKALRSRINYRKLEIKLQNLFENIFSLKGKWKNSQANSGYLARRQLYLQERWRPSTPIYYSANVTDFSSRIQEAVTRILREQGLPVVASPGIEAKAALVDATIKPDCFKQTPSQHVGCSSAPIALTVTEVVSPQPEVQLPKSPVKPSSPLQPSSVTSPTEDQNLSQGVLTLSEDTKQVNIGPSVPESQAVQVSTDATFNAFITVAESLSGGDTSDDVSQGPGETLSGRSLGVHNYHQRHPSILRAFRPDSGIIPLEPPPTTTVSMSALPSRVSSESRRHRSAPSAVDVGSLPDDVSSAALSTTLPTLSPIISTTAEHLETTPIDEQISSIQPITAADTSTQLITAADTSIQPNTEADTSIQPITEADTSIQPITEADTSIQQFTEAGTLSPPTATRDAISQPIGTSVGTLENVERTSNVTVATRSSDVTASTSGDGIEHGSVSGIHQLQSVNLFQRATSHLQPDLLQTSFIQFEYSEHAHQRLTTPSDVLQVTAVSEYEPTVEEEREDNDMVQEFTNSVYDSLHTSMEDVNNEDELAELVAECILSSAVGLALLSADPQVKISQSRFLNLRDRMSSEAMQATIKVFGIKPPLERETTPSSAAAKVQLVPPFSPRPESGLRKISLPQTHFRKNWEQQSRLFVPLNLRRRT